MNMRAITISFELRVYAAAIALLVCASSAAALAETPLGASVSAPLRHDIDRRCAPLDAGAERSNLIYPVRGSYAHVGAHKATIDDVYFFTPDTQTTGIKTSWSCYLGGRLARQRTRTILPSSIAWIRTKYYGDNGTFLTQTDTQEHLIAGDTEIASAAPPDEHLYRSPASLPFYTTFRAHHRQ